MKIETKYRILLSIVLVSAAIITIASLGAIDTLRDSLEDIDEDNRRIRTFKTKKVSKTETPLPNSHFIKQPSTPFVPTSGLSCPVSNLDEFHRSLFLNKDK